MASLCADGLRKDALDDRSLSDLRFLKERGLEGGIAVGREEFLKILSRHKETLRDRFGVRSLALFGSVVRGEARPDSDVDLLVEFERPVGLFEFVRLQLYLEELLGRRVDLVTPDAVRPAMREHIFKEAVRAS